MINKENIRQVVNKEIEGSGIIIIDIQIDNSNNIKIILDSFKGVNINECAKINRLIESNFDRDNEDYRLEISSYGITQPFILPMHFLKNINRQVEVYSKDGNTIKGLLKNVKLTDDKNDIDSIEISNKKKIKEEGKKKKTEVEQIIKLHNNEIQKAKLVPVY
jgi:ribosome maturation factor RimP